MLLISRFITKVLVVVTNKSQCLDDGKGCDKLQLNADGDVTIGLEFKHGFLWHAVLMDGSCCGLICKGSALIQRPLSERLCDKAQIV